MRKLVFIAIIATFGVIVFFMSNQSNDVKKISKKSMKEQIPLSSGSIHNLSVENIDQLTIKGNAGDIDAAFRLYQYYALSTSDETKERYWLEVCAKAGQVVAQYNLAADFFSAKNFNEAKKWALIAKNNGNLRAQNLLLEIEKSEYKN